MMIRSLSSCLFAGIRDQRKSGHKSCLDFDVQKHEERNPDDDAPGAPRELVLHAAVNGQDAADAHKHKIVLEILKRDKA
jgi:hypothetical protein